MPAVKLSVCIPTYNRERYLQECLSSLVPQINSDEVEVVVIDNCSQDNTSQVAAGFVRQNSRVRYFRNEKNLGYAGSQEKCIELARGKYIAILCDDDLYLEGEVAAIVKTIAGTQEYAFLALNYYNFVQDYRKIHQCDFAPEEDVLFKRAYDILNYPSVGHFSGFVFNAGLARDGMAKILAGEKKAGEEKHRGIISQLAVRVTAGSNLPSYFIGTRKLAARIPDKPDYDILRHLCLDYYEFYLGFYQEGIITKQDLAYRVGLVMDRLPKAIIRDLPSMNTAERKEITVKLIKYFSANDRFVRISLPLLNAGKFVPVRGLYKIMAVLASIKRNLVCNIRK